MTALDTRDTAFGPIVTAYDVELGVVELVQLWIADYLAEVCRQHELEPDYLPQPRAYVVSSEVEKMPEDQTPAILVASPGMTDPPRADGQGSYVARWRVTIAVHLSARGNTLALRLVRLYIAAIRALVLQQQGLDTLMVRRFDWVAERYDTLSSIDDRTVCTAELELGIEIAGVALRHAGPLAPIIGPGNLGPDSPTWPISETALVVVDKAT